MRVCACVRACVCIAFVLRLSHHQPYAVLTTAILLPAAAGYPWQQCAPLQGRHEKQRQGAQQLSHEQRLLNVAAAATGCSGSSGSNTLQSSTNSKAKQQPRWWPLAAAAAASAAVTAAKQQHGTQQCSHKHQLFNETQSAATAVSSRASSASAAALPACGLPAAAPTAAVLAVR
jgi:hypothetical protein